MGKREKSRQYQRRNRDKTVLCHIKDFDLYSEWEGKYVEGLIGERHDPTYKRTTLDTELD